MRARGGFEIDMAWEDGAMTRCVIQAKYSQACTVVYKGGQLPLIVESDGAAVDAVLEEQSGMLTFQAETGKRYMLSLGKQAESESLKEATNI